MKLTKKQLKALPKLLEFASTATYVRRNHLERLQSLVKRSLLSTTSINYTENDARALNAIRQYYILELKLNKQLNRP